MTSDKLVWIACLVCFMVSCHNKPSKQFSLETNGMTTVVFPDTLPSYYDLISPLEKSGISYQAHLLEHCPEMSNSREQLAVQTGIIIADLAYLRYFERVSESKIYAQMLDKRLLTLNIPQTEVRKTVEQIENHIYSGDSLMIVLSSGFDELTADLIESQRSALASLLMTGAWIESSYLMLNTTLTNNTLDFDSVWLKHVEFGETIFPMLENFKDNEIQNFYRDFNSTPDNETMKRLCQIWSKKFKSTNAKN